MTTANKHGAVTQPPLYGCAGCYEQCTWPASDLRVHDAECWCALCWDEYKVAETGIGYYDLPAFEPYMPTPDVAGLVEPLAWVTADIVDGQSVNGKPRRIWWENNEGVGVPVYAAPHPPFQLPDFATDPDDSDEGASLLDHGFKWGWNSCLEDVTKAMQSAEQQPAPDVAALVEALELALEYWRHRQQRYRNRRPKWVIVAESTLAAYRKQGGAV